MKQSTFKYPLFLYIANIQIIINQIKIILNFIPLEYFETAFNFQKEELSYVLFFKFKPEATQ